MQQLRIPLLAVLAALSFLLWEAWQTDYGSSPSPRPQDQAETSADPSSGDDAAPAPADSTPGSAPANGGGESPARQDQKGGGRRISVTTDLLEIELSQQGGSIVTARLKEHTVSADNPTPFTLMSAEAPAFIAQLGLSSQDAAAPGHSGDWSVPRQHYRLKESDDRLVVPMRWTAPDGTEIERRYIFQRDSYVVRVEHEITNNSGADRSYFQYTRLVREPTSGDQAFLGARSFIGGVISRPNEPYTKYGFDEINDGAFNQTVTNGWVAMIQHYFLAAAIPTRDEGYRIATNRSGERRILGTYSPVTNIAGGSTGELQTRLFIGPKEQDRLDAVADNLQLTVDYGWFHVLSKPLFEVLNWIHSWVGNWGWSIMILVLLIKLVFYKLSETSYRSMARMRKLQPKMQELRERYSDDKQRMNQEIMELYKREKVNPLGGCLPILIQIPVFIALYWVLLESVELRQAPWILWIDDLAKRDPWYVLPVLMGLSMFVQQKLNPAPMDPIQQKVMMALPFVFTVFFMLFPAGLVLYWVTNNTLSILQQWIITRRVESGNDDDGNAGGGLIKRATRRLAPAKN
jgi:YidC/Oxa1 family membrane protein insertase